MSPPTIALDADQIPGFREALAVVLQVGGVLLDPDAGRALTLVALATAEPYMRAEMLADLADSFADAHPDLAAEFDQVSYTIRRSLP